MRRRSIRDLLIIAAIITAVLPGVASGLAGALAINDTMNAEAQNTIAEHGKIAASLVADRGAHMSDMLAVMAADPVVRDGVAPSKAEATSRWMRDSLQGTDFDYTMLVDPTGRVVASSGPTTGWNRPLDSFLRVADSGRNVSRIVAISSGELASQGLADRGGIAVVAAGGDSERKKTVGSLGLAAAIPIRDRNGDTAAVLIGVEVLGKRRALVDLIAERLGGTATIFQDEVRISTTVLNAQGQRAVGTVASNAVQQAVLKTGTEYTGMAKVLDKTYMARYTPIKDGTGMTIGMLYVGIPLDPYIQARNTFILRFFGAVALAVIAVVLVAGFGARRVTRPLLDVSDAAARVAAGDLGHTVPASRIAEIAVLSESFNAMTVGLAGMISNVQTAVGHLRTVSESVVGATDEQAQSVSRQVAAATETSATLEEMAASYRAVAAGAERVLQLAEDALESADDGRAALRESITATEAMHAGAESTARSAEEVEEVSQRIGEVLGLIDSIAEQTKILALNAAIEASRAGEAGRGFGVVAAEIRKLADSVSASTARIDEMVRGIHSATKKLTALSADQSRTSIEGVELGHRTSDSFSAILEQMAATAAAAREIATAASQQRAAADQVVLAMQQVTGAASDTRNAAEYLSKTAREIDQAGRDLEGGVGSFTV